MFETQAKNHERLVKVLMVDDNRDDVFLMREHLKEFVCPVHMCVAYDGEEALNALRQSLCFSAKQDPDFILLDLGLPKKDGHEVLVEIKKDPGLKHIPVLVLTSSTNRQDMATAYQNQASSYILKPDNLGNYAALVKDIEEFWLKNIA
jgi:two-component system, chemotaxis family, response regulator Rcp1